MIPLHDEDEKTCQFNQNTKALLRMRHFRDTVPLKVEKFFFFFFGNNPEWQHCFSVDHARLNFLDATNTKWLLLMFSFGASHSLLLMNMNNNACHSITFTSALLFSWSEYQRTWRFKLANSM